MESVKIRVSRFDPEAGSSRFDDFTVGLKEKMTVLDCLDQIQRTVDPSLGFRYACRVGMCGSCAMVVNGSEQWTCRTLVQNLSKDEITLEPLRNMPVIRDLAVDFKPLWDKYRRVRPAFEPSPTPKPVLRAEVRRRRERIDPNLQCISCGICYSACGYVRTDPEYLGPHSLLRAFTATEDHRDTAGPSRLAVVDNEHGCWKCHVQLNCTEKCPMELSPTVGIQHLKRAILNNRILNPTRRKFVFTAVGAVLASVSGYVVYQPREWVTVGPAETIPTDTFLVFDQHGKRAFLRRTPDNRIEAMSLRCSHQGCRVDWKIETNEFLCRCHQGVFDGDGIPTSGPPKRPLERYETRVEAGLVQVLL